MVAGGEEARDIQVNDPVKLPASLPGLPHGRQRRFPRSIPLGIRMEARVYRWLQPQLHHHLGEPI
jgi:hypothetical protein